MRKIVYTARTWLLKGVCKAVGRVVRFEPRDHLVVFSDRRGGSTWMAERFVED